MLTGGNFSYTGEFISCNANALAETVLASIGEQDWRMMIGIGFRFNAPPTALAALGFPRDFAISPYVATSP